MFSYMALAEGVIAARASSCWCPACCSALGRGLGSMDSNLVVSSCVNAGRARFKWAEKLVQRTDLCGIGERRRVAQEEGHRLAAKATPGTWFAAQARNHNTIWVGKFADRGDGKSIIKKVEGRDEACA